MGVQTDTFVSHVPRGGHRGAEWALSLALDCERLAAPPLRLSLGRTKEVEIGRGSERAYHRDGEKLRLDLPDRWASQVHARLTRDGEGWVAEDAGSKNGMRVNGVPVQRAELADGDVVECGGTFMVLRHTDTPVRDLELTGERTAAPRTLAPALERELGVLPKIAKSRVAVLVRGDSGTGKEVIASALHALSGRSGPFVAVNCGAIPQNLMESELFGTRRGAFTGAADRPGLVRSADHGTLFLDEVAELPPSSQASLLRVLQEGEIMPLGSDKRTPVDVRILAATNRPLEDLIAEGDFRRDLFARLRGYELRLPPLRGRIEDLGLLVAALLGRLDPDGPPRRLARTAARALFLHPWPYHVRELEQVLRAALAVASTDEIRLEDLVLTPPDNRSPAPEPAGGRERLVALLEKHGGNLSAVARELSTSRSQVQRLMARHGLAEKDFRKK